MSVLPVRDLTTREVLYGARTTRHRYELFRGEDLVGYLDGVEKGGLDWTSGTAVKKSGRLTILDLPAAADGLTRVADVELASARIRPVRIVDGLPEVPLGMYIVSAAPEQWSGTGRTYEVTLHDKCAVLEQDAVAETYVADTVTPILQLVKAVVESAGEKISVDGSDTRSLTAPMVWEAGTSKLRIVNDLLKVLDFRSLWVDGVGAYRATPEVLPAARSIRYSALNDEEGQRLIRELTDGEEAIYSPEWKLDRVLYKVPNRVVAIAQRDGDAAPLSGYWDNTDPESPFSIPSRGRVITAEGGPLVVDVPDFSGEPDPEAATVAFLEGVARRSLIARTQVADSVHVETLPIPIELGDALQFESTPAGIDARHTLWSCSIPLTFDGSMSLQLQEVVDL